MSRLGKGRAIPIPFTAPLTAVGQGKFLNDRAAARIDVDPRRIAMAVTGRWLTGDCVCLPVNAMGTDWPKLGHGTNPTSGSISFCDDAEEED